jgi:hypothetical protein
VKAQKCNFIPLHNTPGFCVQFELKVENGCFYWCFAVAFIRGEISSFGAKFVQKMLDEIPSLRTAGTLLVEDSRTSVRIDKITSTQNIIHQITSIKLTTRSRTFLWFHHSMDHQIWSFSDFQSLVRGHKAAQSNFFTAQPNFWNLCDSEANGSLLSEALPI